MLRCLMLMLIVGSINGCATSSGSFCDNARYIWFADQAQKMDTPAPVKRQILDNNDKIDRLCK